MCIRDRAQAETDATKRGELYNEAEDILLNKETSAVPLVYLSLIHISEPTRPY